MKTKNQLLTLAVLSQVLGICDMCTAEPQANGKRPNILFCIADDASYHHFSANGCKWVSTPNFDRVAKEGILYRNCYTQNAKSAPSRSILLTGLYSWQLGEAANHICNFPADVKVFTEVLSESGYDVAFTGKGWAPGNPGITNGHPRLLTGKSYKKHQTLPPTKEINRCNYAENFKDFLDDNHNHGNKPWFFWFGSHEPHRRYEYGTGVKLGGRSIGEINEVPAFWPDTEIIRNDMLDYGYEIEYFDAQIGKMLAELEARGELDNTLVIVTSDHGMPFPRCKGNDYEYSNHVPFAMMWHDGIKNPGREVSSYISFIDFAPTVLDITGIDGETKRMKAISGKSLKNIMNDRMSRKETSKRKEIILGRERDDYGRPENQGYPIRAIIRDNYLYIWNVKPQLMPAGNPETGYMDVDGSPTKTAILSLNRQDLDHKLWSLSFGLRPEEELYDISADPYCMNNLADNPDKVEIKEQLSNYLKKQLVKQGDPRMGEHGNIFDEYPFDSENKWNFYERVMNGEITEPWKLTGWINPEDYENHPNNKK